MIASHHFSAHRYLNDLEACPPSIAACLDPGEEILWQGQPRPYVFMLRGLTSIFYGITWSILGAFWYHGSAASELLRLGGLVENRPAPQPALHRRGLELLLLSHQSRRARAAHLVRRHQPAASSSRAGMEQSRPNSASSPARKWDRLTSSSASTAFTKSSSPAARRTSRTSFRASNPDSSAFRDGEGSGRMAHPKRATRKADLPDLKSVKASQTHPALIRLPDQLVHLHLHPHARQRIGHDARREFQRRASCRTPAKIKSHSRDPPSPGMPASTCAFAHA